jgi:hypothetical protein
MCGEPMVLWDAKKWPVMVREPIIAIPLSSQTYSCIATQSWSLILHSKNLVFHILVQDLALGYVQMK